jgi:hypothetical protein
MLAPTFVKENHKPSSNASQSVIQEREESMNVVDGQPNGESAPEEKNAKTHT